MDFFTVGSWTAQNVQGCLCAPDGAVEAVNIRFSMMETGIAVLEKSRTVLRVFISLYPALLRCSTVSMGRVSGEWETKGKWLMSLVGMIYTGR